MAYDPVPRTIGVYDAAAQAWIRDHSDLSKIEPIALFFMDQLKGKEVLDAGCGHGLVAKFFSERGLNVTGIDLSRRLLEAATKLAPNAKFKRKDMRDLDFFPETFDGVWACASFQHVPRADSLDTLLGFRKVLKQDGVLYLATRIGNGDYSDNDYGSSRLFTCYTLEQVKSLLMFAGFAIVAEAYATDKWASLYASSRSDFPTIPARKI